MFQEQICWICEISQIENFFQIENSRKRRFECFKSRFRIDRFSERELCLRFGHSLMFRFKIQYIQRQQCYILGFVNSPISERFVTNKIVTATHCNTLQHTATHYNTLQHFNTV